MANSTTKSVDSVLRRSLRRLLSFSAGPSPRSRDQIRELRQLNRDLKADLKRVTQLAEQREVALRSAASGDLRLLAAPVFDEHQLAQLARQRASSYRSADPFPHFVEDGLFDPSILDRVAAEFEAMDRSAWHQTNTTHEQKWSTDDARRLGPFTSALIAQLNAGPFVRFLEELTGIEGLVPDPHLRGGGLHEIRRGGRLGVHADFNVHPRLKLFRRLNLLIFLNKDWQASWGGALELWDRDGQRCVHAFQPVFNRSVLFDTSNFSYHGHPHPLACPPERSRRSVALYYYSLECPTETDRESHGTLFIESRATIDSPSPACATR